MSHLKTNNGVTLEQAAVQWHIQITEQLEELQEKIANLPSPSMPDFHWGHIGDMAHLSNQLEQILRPE